MFRVHKYANRHLLDISPLCICMQQFHETESSHLPLKSASDSAIGPFGAKEVTYTIPTDFGTCLKAECHFSIAFVTRMSSIKEATFRQQCLTTEKAEILLAQLNNLKALNLSHNKLDMLPRGIPSTLIALDLSYNMFTSFPRSERIHNLIELKISNNSIVR